MISAHVSSLLLHLHIPTARSALLHNPCIGPQTRGGPIASRDLVGGAGARMASFARNWPLAAQLGPGTARKRFLSTVGSSGLDSQGLATILDPFRPISADLGPDAADVCC